MSMNINVSSIQLAVSTALENLEAAREKAQTAVTADEMGSAENSLAHAQEAEAEMNRGAAKILATVEQIQAALAGRTAALRDSLKTEALGRVASLVQSGALSLEDVAAALGLPGLPAGAMAPAAKPQASGSKYLNPDKYRNPNTGETWSGRGPAPKWLKGLAVDGKTFEDFRVDAPANAKRAAAQATSAAAPAPAAQTSAAAATPAAQAAPAAAAQSPAAPQATAPASDIGDELTGGASFDADLDGDIGGGMGDAASDIGEMLPGLHADSAAGALPLSA